MERLIMFWIMNIVILQGLWNFYVMLKYYWWGNVNESEGVFGEKVLVISSRIREKIIDYLGVMSNDIIKYVEEKYLF